MTEPIKLTQFSKGAGCGCKIAPNVLQEILGNTNLQIPNTKLLVGNNTADDAAVYDLGDGTALISTTDFFMPIVDDAYTFGQIAAANAISDIYAMGGKPLMALAILGWPIEKLPAALASEVIKGAQNICDLANIPLAGGHSIESTEPIFGLSVNGIVAKENLKQNSNAQVGDLLLLTKPIGVGILATAQKRGLLETDHLPILINQLITLNKVGEALGKIAGVHALTDVTGFGLLGHLLEIAKHSKVSAHLSYEAIPKIAEALPYLAKQIIPDATYRNWNSYSKDVAFGTGVNVMEAFNLLPDPHTNGGLLMSVNPKDLSAVQTILQHYEIACTQVIGTIMEAGEKIITINA
jgi:selenide, water dikinase